MIEGRVHGDPASKRSGRGVRFALHAMTMTGLVVGGAFAGSAMANDHGDDEESWYERIDVSGDFRGRDEVFIRDGEKDRHRLRYRLRIAADTEVNDHVEFGLRLATGPDANSGNQSFGTGSSGAGVDFDPDNIFVDRAYITLKPHGSEKPMFGDSKSITFGKMSNPFYDKKTGPSPIIWDSDINPEGVHLQWGIAPCDCWDANLDVAYFVLDENNREPSRDPGMFGVQVDNAIAITDGVKGQVGVSYYALRKLDDAFYARNGARGNLALSDDNHVDLLDVKAAAKFTAIEDWPITIWGNYVVNLSAEGTGEGKEDTAFGAGIKIGSKSAIAELSVGYFQIQADAVPAVLTDSNIIDGLTNGKGFKVQATKSVLASTDVRLTAFISEELDDNVADLQAATPGDRVRLQTDVIIKF